MLVAFIMPMEHYRLYQKMEGVLDQRRIRFGKSQKMLIIEPIQDFNLSKEDTYFHLR